MFRVVSPLTGAHITVSTVSGINVYCCMLFDNYCHISHDARTFEYKIGLFLLRFPTKSPYSPVLTQYVLHALPISFLLI